MVKVTFSEYRVFSTRGDIIVETSSVDWQSMTSKKLGTCYTVTLKPELLTVVVIGGWLQMNSSCIDLSFIWPITLDQKNKLVKVFY